MGTNLVTLSEAETECLKVGRAKERITSKQEVKEAKRAAEPENRATRRVYDF
jgi:hypothetical protein